MVEFGKRTVNATRGATFQHASNAPRQSTPDWSDQLSSRDLKALEKGRLPAWAKDRKSTRLNSSHSSISYAVFCLKKKKLHEKTVPLADISPHLIDIDLDLAGLNQLIVALNREPHLPRSFFATSP